MNTTLAYLRSRRAWLVKDIAIWGTDREAELKIALTEQVGSDVRLGWWSISLGGQFQYINFTDLTDSRGNQLPASIVNPAIIIIPRGKPGAFIKSVDGDAGFSVARNDSDSAPVLIDVMIFETGQ